MSRPAFFPISHTSVLLAMLMAITVLAAAAPAEAARYDVTYCRGGSGERYALADWRPDPMNDGHRAGLREGCAAGTEPLTIDMTELAERVPGETAGWRLSAPDALAIANWTATASYVVGDRSYEIYMTGERAPGAPAGDYGNGCGPPLTPGIESCLMGAGEISTPGAAFGPFPGLAQSLSFSLGCSPGASTPPGAQTPGCYGSTIAKLTRNVVTFDDSTPPSAPPAGAVPSSELLNATAQAPASGIHRITFSAADHGAGVRQVEALIGGAVVGRSTPSCDPPYTRAQPCPLDVRPSIDLDTSLGPNGEQPLQLVATDVAGNRGVLFQTAVVVRNSGKRIGPGSDPIERGPANGSPAEDTASLTAWWASTARGPSRRPGVVRKCKRPSYQRRHRTLCLGRPGRVVLTRNYGRAKTASLTGRLETRSGRPIVGTKLDVMRLSRAPGVAAKPLRSPTTDARGRWHVRVPLRQGSVKVRVSYRSHVNDTVAVAAAFPTLRVRASSSISVSESRVAAGSRVRFRGRLRGLSGRRRGVAVALQVRLYGRWRTFASPTTNVRGAWSARYRFANDRGSRAYRFRALVQPGAAYPYEKGSSATRSVRVG